MSEKKRNTGLEQKISVGKKKKRKIGSNKTDVVIVKKKTERKYSVETRKILRQNTTDQLEFQRRVDRCSYSCTTWDCIYVRNYWYYFHQNYGTYASF